MLRILSRACAIVLMACAAILMLGLLLAPPPEPARIVIVVTIGLLCLGVWWFWTRGKPNPNAVGAVVPPSRVAAMTKRDVIPSRSWITIADDTRTIRTAPPKIDSTIPLAPISERALAALDRTYANFTRGRQWVAWQRLPKSNTVSIRATLALQYEDANGAITQRTVEARQLETIDDVTYLRAYCQLRQDMRTFRCDRMIRVIDAETGEVAEDDIEEWLSDRADAVTYSQEPVGKT